MDISSGVAEARRVTKPGGPIVIVDNARDDEFSAMAEDNISTDVEFWIHEGFTVEILDSSFDFEWTSKLGHTYPTARPPP